MSGEPTRTPPRPPPGSNRRRHPRYELHAQLQLRAGEGEVALVAVRNISAGGVLVSAPDEPGWLRPGLTVDVFLEVEGGGDELCFAMDAEVLRVDVDADGRSRAIALMWTSSDHVAVAALGRVLERVAKR